MSSPAASKKHLYELVDTLSRDDALLLIDYINNKLDPDELTPEEAEAVERALLESERGETISGEELKREFGL